MRIGRNGDGQRLLKGLCYRSVGWSLVIRRPKTPPASRSHEEYWVEGVKSWFDCNGASLRPDGANRSVNTREALAAYDPDLARFIAEVFCHPARDDNWRYRKPSEPGARSE